MRHFLFRLGVDAPVVYALEGSVATAGSAIRWLRDNLNILKDGNESESLAASVTDTAGCYMVPAFSGLFCPYWRSDARGLLIGLTQAVTAAHIVRATLEAVCYQTCDVLRAMDEDSGIPLVKLQVRNSCFLLHESACILKLLSIIIRFRIFALG